MSCHVYYPETLNSLIVHMNKLLESCVSLRWDRRCCLLHLWKPKNKMIRQQEKRYHYFCENHHLPPHPPALSLCHPSSSPLILPLSNPPSLPLPSSPQSHLFYLCTFLPSLLVLTLLLCVFFSDTCERRISLRSEPGSATACSTLPRLTFTLHGRGAEVALNRGEHRYI